MSGLIGVYSNNRRLPAVRAALFGLAAQLHRGPRGVGIAAYNGELIVCERDGLVTQAFKESDIEAMPGPVAAGYLRNGDSDHLNYGGHQPAFINSNGLIMAVVHSGKIINAQLLAATIPNLPSRYSDADLIGALIAEMYKGDLATAIAKVMPQLIGPYSAIIVSAGQLTAFQDPIGIRPLHLAKLGRGGRVLASETCAIELVGGHGTRLVRPGEIVTIGRGFERSILTTGYRRQINCGFDATHTARPDSMIDGRSYQVIREALGVELAKLLPVPVSEIDLVIPIPLAGNPVALGFCRATGLPDTQGIIKDRYFDHGQIVPDPWMPKGLVLANYGLMDPAAIVGQRIVLLDNGLFTGETAKQIIQLLKEAGAAAVHLMIATPPVRQPCYLGLSFEGKKLLAGLMADEEIGPFLGANSFTYLPAAVVAEVAESRNNGICLACMTNCRL